MAAEEEVPTSRAVRTAMLGKVVAGQAVRQLGTNILIAGRSDDYRTAKLESRQIAAAKAMVATLGTMRGAAMKIGQTLSVLDIGIFPEEVRQDVQRTLARLQNSSPTVSFGKMRKVIETDLGGPIERFFSSFDEVPIASASIGQVYRATLSDGRKVAVKVQYPGVNKAVRADMKNMSLLLRAGKAFVPNMDTQAIADEIKGRIEDELDYELEARNQREVGELYEGHPFVVIPKVHSALSGPHVLVTDYIEGKRFNEIRDMNADTRDRLAEIIFRFYVGGVVLHRQFSPDPHPGNFLLCPDGRVAFLDFGLYQRLSVGTVETHRAILRAIVEGDAEGVHRELANGGFIPDTDAVDAEVALEYIWPVFWWAAEDKAITLSPETATVALIQTINPSAQYFNTARRQTLPPEHAVVLRMFVLVLGTLGQLHGTNNWHRICREWLYGDRPATTLGELDEAHWHVTPGARSRS